MSDAFLNSHIPSAVIRAGCPESIGHIQYRRPVDHIDRNV